MAMARLWQALSRLRGRSRFPLCPVVAALALASGACSMPIGSLNGKDEDKTAADRTGSIVATPVAATAATPVAEAPAEADLVIARAAVSEVLGRGGKDTSAPWENPKTGARGTVTPVASSYTQDGFTCRDFLASYVRAGSEAWLQGEACRMHHGRWEVRKLKPWKRS
jgi:surface antigen